jgi:hypothetical protein
MATGSLLVAGTAYAAPQHAPPSSHGRTGPITVHVGDPRHDLRAERTTDSQSGSVHTTTTDDKYQPTAAEAALDLTGVDYKLVRSGPHPSLRIWWHVAGPIPPKPKPDLFATSLTAVDFEVALRHTPLVVVVDSLGSTGVLNADVFGPVKCTGFSSSVAVGGTTATATVPLSCLAPGVPLKKRGGGQIEIPSDRVMPAKSTKKEAKPPTAVQLEAAASYFSGTGTSGNSTTTIVSDLTRRSRTLNLTPLR